MPTVEGFTPSVLWTTLYGFIAICLLFLIAFRVYDAIHVITKRRKERQDAQKPDFAEKVSKKVVSDLEPRFVEIEKNLDRDKKRLETHEMMIENIRNGQLDARDGLKAICKFMLVISSSGALGEDEKIKDARNDLQNYLAERL